MVPSSPCAPSMLQDGFLYKLEFGTGFNLLTLTGPHLPILAKRHWQTNQFFCLMTGLSKADSCLDTIPALQPLARLRAHIYVQIKGLVVIATYSIVQNQDAGQHQIGQVVSCLPTEPVFFNMRTLAKHWRALRTCCLSQLLWKLRFSKVLSKSYFIWNTWYSINAKYIYIFLGREVQVL